MALKSFVMALKDVTALKGETLADFRNQYKSLTEKDKHELFEHIRASGVECAPPVQLPA